MMRGLCLVVAAALLAGQAARGAALLESSLLAQDPVEAGDAAEPEALLADAPAGAIRSVESSSPLLGVDRSFPLPTDVPNDRGQRGAGIARLRSRLRPFRFVRGRSDDPPASAA